MNKYKIYDNNNKLLSYLYLNLDVDNSLKSQNQVLSSLTKNIYNLKSTGGYCGSLSKKRLKEDRLRRSIFNQDNLSFNFPKPNKSKVYTIIKDTLNILTKNLSLVSPIRVYVFPSLNEFILNKMKGVNGFSFYKNTIVLFINFNSNDWESQLPKTLAHEYNHAIVLNHSSWLNLLDTLVFEGFAEHFREQVIVKGKDPWTDAVSRSDCKKHFKVLKKKLDSMNPDTFFEVFFSKDNLYPNWLGYSLGYYIVEDYIKNTKITNWNELIKIKPNEILLKSRW